jgi:hypothetical protein
MGWTTASMSGTHLSRLKPSRGSITSARSRVRFGASNLFVSVPFFPTSSQSRSRSGSRTEGKIGCLVLQSNFAFYVFGLVVKVQKSNLCHGFWNLRHLIIMRAFGLMGFRRLGMLLDENLYSEFHFRIVPDIL